MSGQKPGDPARGREPLERGREPLEPSPEPLEPSREPANPDGDPVIRPYDPETDFEGMLALARMILGSMPEAEARRELHQYPRKILRADVAVTPGGRIIGYCGATYPYWNDVGMIDYLVVASDRRDQGIGARLVAGIERALREVGARRVCVQTAAFNEAGIRFYERAGYRELARFPGYFHDSDEQRWDMVWLDRSLDGL